MKDVYAACAFSSINWWHKKTGSRWSRLVMCLNIIYTAKTALARLLRAPCQKQLAMTVMLKVYKFLTICLVSITYEG
jgi:hypothetical protein